MRIGIVAPEFPPDVGGVETYSFELARALHARGHEVTVFARRDGREGPAPAGVGRVGCLTADRRRDRVALRGQPVDAWVATNAAYAWLALEDARPVVVCVHGNDFLRPYVLCERPRLARGPLWRLARALAPLERRMARRRTSAMLGVALPRAAGILANSRYTRDALLARVPACRPLVRVAWVGVGEDFLRWRPPAGLPRQRTRLVTVSRLSEPRKNVDLVLRALARLAADAVAFSYTVIGDGPDRPRLEALARRLGLAGRVRFLGRVDGERLRRELAASGLMVLTASALRHSHEGFGIVYLEANACGTPVLAARTGGAVEAVAEGESGFFVDELTPEGVAEALGRFLRGGVRFDEAACRAHAGRFRWARVAEAVEGCLGDGTAAARAAGGAGAAA